MLVVFGGLPGTGKTTVARLVAARLRAAYLRIDAIEQAMRSAGVLAAPGEVGPAGYMAAYALAEANLRLGLTVVADCANPLP
jgi:predicted kinase